MTTTSKPILLIGLIVIVGLILAALFRPERVVEPDAEPAPDVVAPEMPVEPDPYDLDAEPQPEPEPEPEPAPTPMPPRETPAVDLSAPFRLLDSEIVERWIALEGYTIEDIIEAQDLLRRDGYPPDQVEDPGNVRRLLPPRHVSTVVPRALTVPATAAAGVPIPFRLEGIAPDPSFTFTRFIIEHQGPVIRIRASGHSDGLMVAAYDGPGGVVFFDGEIPPLDPGAYKVFIPELGPHGSFDLVVE